MSTLNETFWDWLRLVFRVTLGIILYLCIITLQKKRDNTQYVLVFFPVRDKSRISFVNQSS